MTHRSSRSAVSAASHVRRWMDHLRANYPSAYRDLATPSWEPRRGTNSGSGNAEQDMSGIKSVVVGLSGGADSLALTIGAVRAGLSVHAVVVDHGLQEGSDRVAHNAAEQARKIGVAEADVVRVHVPGAGEGPAREARYKALGSIAAGRPLLVAHTANDDAEGFLVALSRGSGTQSLAGMRSVSLRHPAVTCGAAWVGRPLLAASRADTEAECLRSGLTWWEDPHNYSQQYLRSRVRQELLPVMEEILGSSVRGNLARSARMLREDADALDAWAVEALSACTIEDEDHPDNSGEDGAMRLKDTVAQPQGKAMPLDEVARLDEGTKAQARMLAVERLATYHSAVRYRVYKHWLSKLAGPLTASHIHAIDALVVRWRGQGAVSVPWAQHCPTMNEDRRASHRLVVRRVGKTLIIDHLLRQPYSEGR
ncbi:tRNA lysidine(34) synthetase TilS [Corynebacterium sp. 4HC-13]|uniref:tRNA lysidine(34) synthetase TilS n=1 Tax=Corynebacterium anserum TaxID=2684406 RepID=UPI001639A094|nr:tRNA lysidine(34) synthetase TilS [Corynebacterium anserum]MBC2681302.1 tRNA lysidine(34) synthetase TilS [Corynebacterium anserum]